MSLSRFLKKRNRPSPAPTVDIDAGGSTSSEIHYDQIFQFRGTAVFSAQWWRRIGSIDDRLSSLAPTSTSTLPLQWMTEDPTPEAGAHEIPWTLSMEPLPETFSGSGPWPNRGTEVWDMVMDGPSDSNSNWRFDAVGAFWPRFSAAVC
jgi:hypothetical protein